MYHYSGPAIEGLLQSYSEDEKPFVTEECLNFPSRNCPSEEIKLLKQIFFPNYWNQALLTKRENRFELEKILTELGKIFFKGIRPYVSDEADVPRIVNHVIDELPNIRTKLKKDVEAAYYGDPAAKTYTEIIRSYPGFSAILVQRVAYIFYNLGVISYARELTEYIHSKTGIDIHPGAEIGEYFFIDHGTGVVIGETSVIGDNVRIYQGVTLGGLSLEDVDSQRDKRRHPTIGDKVIIYANATILGADTKIGEGCVIGGDVWLTSSVPPNTTVMQGEPNLKYKQTNQQEN